MFTIYDKVPSDPHLLGLEQLPPELRALYERLQDVLTVHSAAINGSDVWDDVGFDAGSFPINPIGVIAPPTRDDVEASFPGSLLFSGSQDNIIANSFQMPHSWREGSAIYPHIHWTKPAGGTGDNVTWQWYYRVYRQGTAPTAWVGPIAGTMVVDHGGVAEAEAITTFGPIDMQAYKISQNVAWRLYRRGASDAFAGTARLIQFDVHYQRNSSGSTKEFIK